MQNRQNILGNNSYSMRLRQYQTQQNHSFKINQQENINQKDFSTERSDNMSKLFLRNQLSDSNPFKSHHSHQQTNYSTIPRSQSLSKINKNVHDQIIQASLSHQLASQIAIKQQLKKYKKQEELQMQKQIIMHNKLLQEKERQKQKKFKETFKQQAQQIAKLKQLKKDQQKYGQYVQKTKIGQRYKNNLQTIKKLSLGIQQPINPKLYFDKLQKRISQSSLQNYNPQNEVKVFPIKSHHKPSYDEAEQLKNRMRQTLLEQIRMSSQKKMNQRIQRTKTKFVEEKYKIRDNPIINPIDMKVAKDNPYLNNEYLRTKVKGSQNDGLVMGFGGSRKKRVQQKPITQGNSQQQHTSSFLSRRGSNSLSRLIY